MNRPRPDPRDPPAVVVTIEIDDECYRLRKEDAPPLKVYRLRKLEGPREGATYTVEQFPNGFQRCSCPDWQFRRRACKHIQSLWRVGCLDEPRPAAPQVRTPVPSRPDLPRREFPDTDTL